MYNQNAEIASFYINEKSMTNHHYCVILAGGRGRRLWPCSREQYPKQFIDFFGVGRTQLQQTFDRFARLLPTDHIYINTNEHYADLVREQLPDLPADNILAEPIYRNTAPSVAWANHRISRIDPQAVIAVTPSDQTIQNEQAFERNIMDGLAMVSRKDVFLTMGIKPTRPEPGYGYIQLGEQVEDNVCRVQSFTEKPERDFARMFMESGEFYWNTGLFLASSKVLTESFSNLLPPVLRQLVREIPCCTNEQENAYIHEHFPSYPNLSIDYGILERADNVCVMKCNFGWADLGTWHGIYEAMQKSDDDNVILNSQVIIEGARNNIIKMPEGRLAVIEGLEGFIVAEHDNVLLICKKEDSSALVRKYANEVGIKCGPEFV